MCGLFGFSSYNNSVPRQKLDKLLNCLASESQVRGTQATGIAYNNKHKMVVQKDSKAADDMKFQISKNVSVVVGHTRHSTQGTYLLNRNNHPFDARLKSGKSFSLCHNGVLTNDKLLRTQKNLPKTNIETDSFVAVQLLQQHKTISHKSLKEMAEAVEGSFAFTVLDHNDSLYFVKGDNPLSIIHFEKLGLYVYASTDEILWRALVDSGFIPQIKNGEYTEIPITEGQILSIDKNGKLEYSEFEYDVYGYYPRWYDSCSLLKDADEDADAQYLREVKGMAVYMGYDNDFVDRLLSQGFTVDEIESFLFDDMDGYYL